MIAVFAYAFAHRKTQDFLVELALAGRRDVTVIGAPFRKLGPLSQPIALAHTLQAVPALDTQAICRALGFEFVELAHDRIDDIAALVRARGLRLGIVSGARILKRGVIEAFADGIVNFHPGKIPETSGLDAFFYTLKTGVDAGVTTHFIDPRVDAGHFLAFDAVPIGPDDGVEAVQENAYRLQIPALRRFLADWQAGRLAPRPIDRPAKNQPMAPAEKHRWLGHFPAWRAARFRAQQAARLFRACEAGDRDAALACLEGLPDLIETRTPEGWTPLIVACFHQQAALAEALLDRGADPNATGRKGTTVLMYAKTALMERDTGVDGADGADTGLLDLLIARGADPARRDMHGRTVLDYVTQAGAGHLVRYFQARTGAA